MGNSNFSGSGLNLNSTSSSSNNNNYGGSNNSNIKDGGNSNSNMNNRDSSSNSPATNSPGFTGLSGLKLSKRNFFRFCHARSSRPFAFVLSSFLFLPSAPDVVLTAPMLTLGDEVIQSCHISTCAHLFVLLCAYSLFGFGGKNRRAGQLPRQHYHIVVVVVVDLTLLPLATVGFLAVPAFASGLHSHTHTAML